MPIENSAAEPLKVERSTITKLVVTGAPSLDPITVFLEDLAPCKGEIPSAASTRAGTPTGAGCVKA